MSEIKISKSNLKLLLEKAFIAGYESPIDIIEDEITSIMSEYTNEINEKKENNYLQAIYQGTAPPCSFNYTLS